MKREEWIDYYESIYGHKPSVLEVAEAEKMEKFQFFLTHLSLQLLRVMMTYKVKVLPIARTLSGEPFGAS